MTKTELSALIKEQTAPMIRELVGRDVADLVREAVSAALKSAPPPPNYAARLFTPGADSDHRMRAQDGDKLSFFRCLRATAAAKHMGAGPERAIEILRQWGDNAAADAWMEARTKALASNDPTAGGFLVPPQFSTDVIEFLRPAAVLRSLNPQTMPMPNGTVKVPKITSGTTASYIGENQNIGKTEPRFGQLTLTFKKLAALVPISNDLIRYSSPNADAVVRDDVVRALATREDKAFIRDDGTSGTPRGLKNWIHNDNKFAANASVSLANTTIDLGKLLQLVMAADIPLIVQQNITNVVDSRPGWIFSPRTWRYLTTLQTTTGAYAFRDEMIRGTLWGFPFRVTSQVLETYTAGQAAETGGTQSEIYFGAFAHAVIGEALALQVDASMDAAYHDGSNVVAAFSQDQTVIRVIEEHDFVVRHEKAFALATGLTWGV